MILIGRETLVKEIKKNKIISVQGNSSCDVIVIPIKQGVNMEIYFWTTKSSGNETYDFNIIYKVEV